MGISGRRNVYRNPMCTRAHDRGENIPDDRPTTKFYAWLRKRAREMAIYTRPTRPRPRYYMTTLCSFPWFSMCCLVWVRRPREESKRAVARRYASVMVKRGLTLSGDRIIPIGYLSLSWLGSRSDSLLYTYKTVADSPKGRISYYLIREVWKDVFIAELSPRRL